MPILSTIKIALRAMNANRVRTGLTVLGMVIGIASVIIVFSAGDGINGLIMAQINSFGGSDLIETEIKVPSAKKGEASERQSAIALVQGAQITTLSLKDLADIKKLPNIKDGYAGIVGQERISYGPESRRGMLLGVTASYIGIDRSTVARGRFFTATEDKSLARVAVLGSKIKEKLFGESDPLGKFIIVRKTKFRVIGVMAERGAVMQFDFDDLIYVPVRTLQKRIMGINHVLYMMHQVVNQDLVKETEEEMRYLLRENHGIAQPVKMRADWRDTDKDDFRVISMTESMDIIKTVTGAITLLLLAIVVISLVVGGVGILNIMYVAVSERTAEIGLRKAVGAKYSDIMWQFLLESVLITLIGALLGILFGLVVSRAIAWGACAHGLDWHFSVPLRAFITAIAFSFLFGILFGVYPARKAARMDPVSALRFNE